MKLVKLSICDSVNICLQQLRTQKVVCIFEFSSPLHNEGLVPTASLFVDQGGDVQATLAYNAIALYKLIFSISSTQVYLLNFKYTIIYSQCQVHKNTFSLSSKQIYILNFKYIIIHSHPLSSSSSGTLDCHQQPSDWRIKGKNYVGSYHQLHYKSKISINSAPCTFFMVQLLQGCVSKWTH